MEALAHELITKLFGTSAAHDTEPFMGIIGIGLLIILVYWFRKI